MKKYYLIALNSLQEHFAYRLNFALWRVRMIISVVISFFLWRAIFETRNQVFGYQEAQMLTYVLLISFLNGIVLSSQTFRVAEEINRGVLSNILIKPLSYFGYILSRDVSDKIINVLFSVIEIIFFIVILRPPVFIQTSFFWLSFFIITSVFAAFLFFEIGLILSIVGFWSRETWAPRFIFSILVAFLAGTFFPLDILPLPIYNLMLFLPFSYLVFFPLKIYLGHMELAFMVKGLFIMGIWMVLLYYLVNYLWKKGLKIYTSEGI